MNAAMEPVWVLKGDDPNKLCYHSSVECPMVRPEYGARVISRREAEAKGYSPCRRNGPCR